MPNHPIDILTIAAAGMVSAEGFLNYARCLNHGPRSVEIYENAVANLALARLDLGRVHRLIEELDNA